MTKKEKIKLTPKQDRALAKYGDSYIKNLVYNTTPINKLEMEKALKDFYKLSFDTLPTIIWVNDPTIFTALDDEDRRMLSRISNAYIAEKYIDRTLLEGHLAILDSEEEDLYFHFENIQNITAQIVEILFLKSQKIENKNNEKTIKMHMLLDKILKHGILFAMFHNLVVVSENPTTINYDDKNRLHCMTGPALAFGEHMKIFSVHGVRVPEWVIMEPEKITVKKINKEENSEINRVMIEIYGWDKYTADSKSELIDDNKKYGKLYRANVGGWQEDILYLEVTNRTAEPDGTFKRYVLPLHPELCPMLANGAFGDEQELSSLNAVASTFGMTGYEYETMLRAES